MKKSIVICAGLCAVLLASCGTKESAYRKMYDKAQAAQRSQQETATTAPVVAPVQEQRGTVAPVRDNYDNVVTRSEDVTLVSGSGLKAYSVVVGSFSLKANAEGLVNTLKGAGYDAQLAYNSQKNMYRVVATTFDDKGSAAQSRDALRATYADAWLLYKK